MFGNKPKQNEIKMTWEQVRAESVRIKAKEEVVAKTKAEYEAKLEDVEEKDRQLREKDRQLQEQENQLRQTAREIVEKSAKMKEILHNWKSIKEKTEAEQQQLTEEITRKQKELERLKSDIVRAEIDLKSKKERTERELSQIISQQTAAKQQFADWKAKAEKDFAVVVAEVVETGNRKEGSFMVYIARGNQRVKTKANGLDVKVGSLIVYMEFPSGKKAVKGLYVPFKKSSSSETKPVVEEEKTPESQTAAPEAKGRENIKVD
jgi:DNA repair exonuclease SbcCD ATPase subunit